MKFLAPLTMDRPDCFRDKDGTPWNLGFTTGREAPQGFPFVPVVQITGNEKTWSRLRDYMDIYVKGPVI